MFGRVHRRARILALLSVALIFVTSNANADIDVSGLALTPVSTGPISPSIFSPVCEPISVAPITGLCGTANGSALTGAPTSALCNAGTSSFVSGTGPWTWICSGSNGGGSAGCMATVAVPGSCGTSNNGKFSQAPGTNLCVSGIASSVSGTGPWSWSCAGAGGTASCSATVTPINGLCGASNGGTFASAPASNLCSFGGASAVAGTGPWTWSCAGTNGGSKASCGANLTVPVQSTSNSAQPTPKAVTPVTTVPSTTGTTPEAVTPAAPVVIAVKGVCGSADDTISNVEPTSGLCSTGAASGVTGTGPWYWSCSGSNGGASASCTVNTTFNPADPTSSGYHLTFDDEFTTLSTGLPSATNVNWETNFWYRSSLASNYDWLPLDPSICDLGLSPYSITDGVLSIATATINPALTHCGAQESYTGGHLDTRNSFSQTYGYFETRAKASNVFGTEFAFWLLPEDGSWPPEIDALELLGRMPTMPVLTNHTDENGTISQYPFYPILPDLSQDFHTYGVLWTSTVITWYIDDVQVAQTPTRSDEHKPFYLILEFGTGACNDGWADCPSSSNDFSDSAQVDWVHAWSSN